MSPTYFTVWQLLSPKKFSLETNLLPKAMKFYTFSLSNLMTQFILSQNTEAWPPANLVTSRFLTGSSALVLDLSLLRLFWAMWGAAGWYDGPHSTLASVSHIAADLGRLWQDNEENGLDHFCNKCKQENRQPGGVYGQRCTQQSH